VFGYMHSQRKREEARLARIAKLKDEDRISRYLAGVQAEVAAEAANARIPLPATKAAQELLAHRASNQVKVEVPAAAEIPEPAVVYTDDDYLWVRTVHTGGPIITMPNTLRCSHD
jgi:hypothetical protein